MKRVKISELLEFSKAALIKAGVSEENAALTAETLVGTDVFGVLTHGTKNLPGSVVRRDEREQGGWNGIGLEGDEAGN